MRVDKENYEPEDTKSEVDRGYDEETQGARESDANIVGDLRAWEIEFTRFLWRQHTVAEVLATVRRKQQMRLIEASYRAGISKAYLWRLEHGERRAPLVTLDALGRSAYGFTDRMMRDLLVFARDEELRTSVHNQDPEPEPKPTVH